MEAEAQESNPQNDAVVNSFCEITSASKQEALFFLESHNWDLDAAVSTFLDNNAAVPAAAEATHAAPRSIPASHSPSPSPSHSPNYSPSQSPPRSRSPSPASRAPYQLRSKRAAASGSDSKGDANPPSASRPRGIRTLSDLNRPAKSGSDSESDEPQEYYTGGEKSGMLVQDPTKGSDVDSIFSQARQLAATQGPLDVHQPSSSSKSFSGTARLLSGETVPTAAPQPPETIVHTITFWRNGFSVDDGPLRRLDDPENAPFLESIKKSECPKELEPGNKRVAIYFDNIIPNVSGVRKSVFYFLNPGYWTGKGGNKLKEGGICSCIGSAPPNEHLTPDDEDVLEEENLVKQQTKEGTVDPNIAVQIRGLVKTYPGTFSIGCCKCRRTKPHHAVKGLWVNFAKDQLFCLLGPNGAGKTTAISCLTGITPFTGGDALIYGDSARSSVGMANIRKIIGFCPQFDILWNALSGQEHLHLFASIKGLPSASVKSDAEKLLAEVRLTEAAKVRAGSYSGGMKRRLSFAVALIGDPKLIILDEPTTGMDPITRRHVWDVIEGAKRGRAIVLTTHSMEEADILGDRIGIMAKGRLRCIGTSIRLKSRFGTGFIANVSFSGSTNEQRPPSRDVVATSHHEAVKEFFKYHLGVEPKEENREFLTFVIPHDREGLLMNFFAELQNKEREFGIADIQLGLTTLEEVFLNIAGQAELEAATAEGRLVTLTLASGASVQIPVGARFVGIPGTESAEHPSGVMVEVFWQQDDSGALCISGHSPETPVPPSVEITRRDSFGQGRSRGQARPVQGIVINPDQITTRHSRSNI